MKTGVLVAAFLGIAAAIYVTVHAGIGPVFDAVVSVGWSGFALLCAAALLMPLILGVGWFVLIAEKTTFWTFVIGRQIRDSAGDILPFSQLGGILIGARAVSLRGLSPALSFASMIADVTTELMAEIVFVVGGTALCITALRNTASTAPLVDGLILGPVLLVPSIAVFVFLQRRGGALAGKLAERWIPAAVQHTAAFGKAIEKIYDSPGRLAASSAMHLVGWVASGLWIWLAFRLMGARISPLNAVAIESLLAALRSATVFVPAAIGVQEAGYAALAPLFGVGPEVGIAVSLLKRAKDIAIGVPVLLTWQAMEGKRALMQEPKAASEN